MSSISVRETISESLKHPFLSYQLNVISICSSDTFINTNEDKILFVLTNRINDKK